MAHSEEYHPNLVYSACFQLINKSSIKLLFVVHALIERVGVRFVFYFVKNSQNK